MANRKPTGFIDGLGQALDGVLPTPGGVAKGMLNAGASLIGMFRNAPEEVIPDLEREQLAAVLKIGFTELTTGTNLIFHNRDSFSIQPTPQKILNRGNFGAKIRDDLLLHMPEWELVRADAYEIRFRRAPREELERRERFGGLLDIIAPPSTPEHGGTLVRLPDGYDDRNLAMRLGLISLIEKVAPGKVLYGFPAPGIAEVGDPDGRKLFYGARATKVVAPKNPKTAELAAVIEADAEGYTLAKYDAITGRVVLAKIDRQTDAIRKRFAAIMGCEPSDLEVTLHWTTRLEAVVIASPLLDAIGDPDKRAKKYSELMLALPDSATYKFKEVSTASGIATTLYAFDDPLKSIIAPVGAELKPSIKRIPFAVNESNEIVPVQIWDSHLLMGGRTGSGKSGGIRAVLAGLAQLDNVALIGIDPKLVELAIWKNRFSGVALQRQDWLRTFEAVDKEMMRRYAWMNKNQIDKLEDQHFTPERPFIVLIVDEVSMVFNNAPSDDKKSEADRMAVAERISNMGRAAGISLVFATQKPEGKNIPTNLRDNIPQRVAYATADATNTRLILGDAVDAPAHTITRLEQGICYLFDEDAAAEGRSPIVRARTIYYSKEDGIEIAHQNAHRRIELPWLPEMLPLVDEEEEYESDSGDDTATSPSSTPATPQRIVLPKPDQQVFNVWDSRLAVPTTPSAPVIPVERASISPEELFTPPAEADAVEAPAQTTAFIGTPLEREMERRNALLDEVGALYPPGSEVPVFVAPEVEPLSPEVQLPPTRRKKTEPPRIDWGVPPTGGAS